MPTPVSLARQCLTPEAAHALDEAVAVARRRGHAQTTSLHAVSALLALPSSTLREACARARNCAYSSRLQFKALELCLSVSLDRVSSGQLSSDPPVSNSLMAAIKRSQANQRRQPENFHLYHQIQQSNNSSVAVIKVELQQLILSILDDPVVSRVFSEAGFRSSEIKLAILRPLPQLYKFSRSRAAPPIFLCNLNDSPARKGTSFTFPGFGGFLEADENSRRIGEVLAKRKNPLLVGVCAYGALKSFSESVERKYNNNSSFLPLELPKLNIVSIENEISRFVNENSDKEGFDMKIEEVNSLIQGDLGCGVVVNFGELKIFVNENCNDDNGKNDVVGHVVAQLTRFLKINGDKVWLIGSVATYETYSKLSKFSAIEKDWDLQLLPITSVRHSSMAESYPRSSLMESFVPLAGFFSTPSDFKTPLNSSFQCQRRGQECNEKSRQEVAAFSREALTTTVADQHLSCLPSWLQMAEISSNKGVDPKTTDDGMLLNTEVIGLQKKLDDTCQNLHQTHPLTNLGIYQASSQVPTVTGFRLVDNNKDASTNSGSTKAQPNDKKEGFLSKLLETPSKEDMKSNCSLSNSSGGDGTRTSPPSDTSVITDLGLRISSDQSSSSMCHGLNRPYDLSNYKVLFKALIEQVQWQDEALNVICQEIVQQRMRNGRSSRGDIWFNFIGNDRRGKRKVAIALAEMIYGRKENFFCVDLGLEDTFDRSQDVDNRFRGKTMVDYVVEELWKKPLSVVFLENLDKADVYTRTRLVKAIQTGKFLDSYGREVSTNNAMFVTTLSTVKETRVVSSRTENLNYCEETILRAKSYPMQIIIDQVLGRNISTSVTMREVNKRKLIGQNEDLKREDIAEMAKRAHWSSTRNLDLNLPANMDDVQDGDTVFQDFFDPKVKNVIFKPFDFQTRADKILNDVNQIFDKIVGARCLLEVDTSVMEQLLAVEYLSEDDKVVKDWLENVLRNAFVEVEKRYNLTSHFVMKLVSQKDCLSKESKRGVWLPREIIIE